MIKKSLTRSACFLAALFSTSTALTSPSTSTGRVTTTEQGKQRKYSPLLPEIRDISYGEESRKYRRTVYSHDDWVKHRSPDRFVRNLAAIGSSGVYKNLAKEVLATTSIATFIVIYNCIVGGYVDFENVKHEALISSPYLSVLELPLVLFTLASPSLGLLLVFRTNASYNRWDEARKNWGMNINHTRNLVRMASAYYDRTDASPEQIERDLQRVSLATWAFVRAMQRHLSPLWQDEENFAQELKEKLPPRQAQRILDASHRPNRALQDLSFAIEALPMHMIRKNEIHRSVTIFEDNLGSSERLLTSPVPLFYSHKTARFLSFWLLFLPFALWDPFADTWNHAGMIPATAAISIFLFGIEELATQLEEPFTILPMQDFCDKIFNGCTEIVSWQPNDNGMFDDDPAPAGPVKAKTEESAAEMVVENKQVEPVLAAIKVEASAQQATSSRDYSNPDVEPKKKERSRRLTRKIFKQYR